MMSTGPVTVSDKPQVARLSGEQPVPEVANTKLWLKHLMQEGEQSSAVVAVAGQIFVSPVDN